MEGLKLIPDSFKDLLQEDTKAFAFLATVFTNGNPQVTPVWFNTDQQHILINSASGRVKDRNMRSFPNVAIAILDPKNPYRYSQIRGKIVEITTEGAREHINALSKKYTGNETFAGSPAEERVIYKMLPENCNGKE